MAEYPVLEAWDAGTIEAVWRAGVRQMLETARRDRIGDLSEGEAGVYVGSMLCVRAEDEWARLDQAVGGYGRDEGNAAAITMPQAYDLWERLQDKPGSVQRTLFQLANPERGYEAIIDAKLQLAAHAAAHEALGGEGVPVEVATPAHAGVYCPAAADHRCRRMDCVGMVCMLMEQRASTPSHVVPTQPTQLPPPARYELEVFSGERAPYALTQYIDTDLEQIERVAQRWRETPGVVYVSLTEWRGNIGTLLASGWCHFRSR